MKALEYSNDALNALDMFLECDHILFVEGDDDVLFWKVVFDKCSGLKVDIRPVGGVKELQPYVEKVISGDLTCLVAQDSDYVRHTEGFTKHSRVLHTYGYSIENTLYARELISFVVDLWSKQSIACIDEVDEWLHGLCVKTEPLFKLDFVNYKYKLEIDTGAGHCQKFMKGRSSDEIDLNILNEHMASIGKRHGANCLGRDSSEIAGIPVLLIMRGHFLQSAVLRFVNRKIKSLGRKANVSADSLYAHAIHFFQAGFLWDSEEGEYYSNQVLQVSH